MSRMYFVLFATTVVALAEPADKPSPFNYHSASKPASTTASAPAASAAPTRVGANASADFKPASTSQVEDFADTGTACFGGGASSGTQLTAAHPSLPLGTRVEVTAVDLGKTVAVTITGRAALGGGRVISVSKRAAEQLGFLSAGTARVKLRILSEKSDQ